MLLKVFACLLLFTSIAQAQTINHGLFQGSNPQAVVKWVNPQAQGDTIIAGVEPPGGTLSDTAGDTFTQICVSGNSAIWTASNVNASPANVLTYTPPSGATNVTLSASEQTGTLIFNGCGSGSGSSSVPLTPAAAIPTGASVYAFLASGQCCSGTTVSSGMSFVNGAADTWFGAGIYSGWAIDAFGVPTGPVSFTYANGLGGGSGSAVMAVFTTAPVLASVSITVSGNVCYDTGASLFGQNSETISILELENGVWVTIGNPTVAPNCTLSGTVTANPNFTDSGGNVDFSLSLPVLAGSLPPVTLFIPASSLQHGSTGVTVTFVMFQGAPGGVKASGMALTP